MIQKTFGFLERRRGAGTKENRQGALDDPHGAIVAAASVDRKELLQADISREVVDLARDRIRVFEHRRSDL